MLSPLFRFKTEEENSMSAPITWEEAQPLMAEYYRRPDSLKVSLPSGVITTLKGLRFSVKDIQTIMDQDGITDIYLMFANSPVNPTNITIIAGGVADPEDNGGELNKNVLFDYCEPCPSKCPTNM